MSRLTTKIEDGFYVADHAHNTDEVTHKLGKLEDLEEEIGCPLEVIFKALGHWIYDEDGKAWYIEHYYQEHNIYQLHSVRNFGRIADKKFNTKDYKKTWWLKEDRSE